MADGARQYAIRAHGDQRYGAFPYSVHLDAVAEVLREFGYHDTLLIAAAYLHDTIEDTQTTYESLSLAFGPEIATLVWLVTDQPGKNRAERHEKTYLLLARHSQAVAIKLADRIANVRASIESNPSLLTMYKREYGDFKSHLQKHIVEKHVPMWKELDRLLLPEAGRHE